LGFLGEKLKNFDFHVGLLFIPVILMQCVFLLYQVKTFRCFDDCFVVTSDRFVHILNGKPFDEFDLKLFLRCNVEYTVDKVSERQFQGYESLGVESGVFLSGNDRGLGCVIGGVDGYWWKVFKHGRLYEQWADDSELILAFGCHPAHIPPLEKN